jgi:hypothetical protein
LNVYHVAWDLSGNRPATVFYLRFENRRNVSSEQKVQKRTFQYQIQAGAASFGVFNTDQYILKGNVSTSSTWQKSIAVFPISNWLLF